jgi:hypothetical protein
MATSSGSCGSWRVAGRGGRLLVSPWPICSPVLLCLSVLSPVNKLANIQAIVAAGAFVAGITVRLLPCVRARVISSCASDQERESSWLCQHVSLAQAQQQHNDDNDPVVSLATTASSCSRWSSPSPVIPTPPIACLMTTTLTRSCCRTSSPSHLQPGRLAAR